MGNLWIPDLADWLRAAGLDVIEYPGWLTRSRSSGGFDDIRAIQLHHDASAIGRSGQRAADAHWRDHADKPVGNLALDRKGVWWVGAAGASNTSGKGGPLATSRGTIPLDAANRYVISIEAANNGVGEIWTQLPEYVAGVAAIIRGLAEQGAYDGALKRYVPIILNPTHGDVHAHFEWAPTRKIDPCGPPPTSNGGYAVAGDRYMRWHMPSFRGDVHDLLNKPEPEEPNMPESPSVALIWSPRGYANTFLIGAGSVTPLTPETYSYYRNVVGLKHFDEDHPQMLKSVLHACGLTQADLAPKR